jgi:lauroyl/myristoyl acyltransferase
MGRQGSSATNEEFQEMRPGMPETERRATKRFPLSFRAASDREAWRNSVRRSWLTIKDVIWFLYLFPARGLARLLPTGFVIAAARAMNPIGRQLLRGRKRVLVSRLEKVLESRAAAEEVADQYFRNALLRAGEDLVLDRITDQNRITCLEIKGGEYLQRALANGRGAILLTGHFFANRVAKHHLASLGYSPLSVRNSHSQEPSSGRVGMRFLRPRYDSFLHSIIRDEVCLQDPECTLKIFKRLRENGVVNIHLDVGFSSVFITTPFLGNPRQVFPTGFLRLATLAQAPILPTVCLGNSRGLRIEIDEPFLLAPGRDESELYRNNLPDLIARLESQILRWPDQWELWIRI